MLFWTNCIKKLPKVLGDLSFRSTIQIFVVEVLFNVPKEEHLLKAGINLSTICMHLTKVDPIKVHLMF